VHNSIVLSVKLAEDLEAALNGGDSAEKKRVIQELRDAVYFQAKSPDAGWTLEREKSLMGKPMKQ
jgi:hypothetical protein